MNRSLRIMRSVMLTLAFVAAIALPALSLDRVQWLFGENPPSAWMNYMSRDVRLGMGQYEYNALGTSNGYFANLCTTVGTGLNVTAGPCSTNTLAALYQYLPEEASSFGGPGATALPVDNTQVELQGLMTNAQAATIGPLNPPGTSGQSIIYAVECKVNTVDTTSQTVNFVSSQGVVTSGSANRDRADQVFCQSKAGAAAVSPSAPTIDTGYVGVSQVTVAYGAASLTSANISTTTANGFYGYARVASAGLSASLPVCTDANSKVTTSGCATVTVLDNGGNAQTGEKVILISGVTGASSVNTCGPYNAAGFCATIALTGSSQFTSGGSSTASPSFSCASGWAYSNVGNFTNAFSASIGNGSWSGNVSITAGSPNTIYVDLGAANLPFRFVCMGQ